MDESSCSISAEGRVKNMENWKETKCGKCKIQRSKTICNSCRGYNKFIPMTQADRIRSFSDEELAEFIEQVSTDSMETISFGTKEYEEIWEHKETALKWLQSDVEN